jgi:hypothetical protein
LHGHDRASEKTKGIIPFIPHYEKTLGAVLISERRMAIFEKDAQVLLDKYFPETEAKL